MTTITNNVYKKKGKEIGRIYGICHGENIFINTFSPKLKPKTKFTKIQKIGISCYFIDRHFTSVPTGNGQSVTTVSIAHNLLNIYSGKVTLVTKRKLKQLLANNSKLLQEFKKETGKIKKNPKIPPQILRTKNHC